MTFEEEVYSLSPRRKLEKRLSQKYLVDENGCWNFTGRKGRGGYGRLDLKKGANTERMNVGAHRISYLLHHGNIPAEKVVMHRCDNPACINPDHLELGDQLENIHDCIRRGRFVQRTDRASKSEQRIIIGWNDEEMIVFTNVYALSLNGFSNGGVSTCVHGHRSHYRGYKWRYEDRTIANVRYMDMPGYKSIQPTIAA